MDAEKQEKIKEQNRIRAKRRYDKAKELINEKRRQLYIAKKDKLTKEPEPQPQPIVEPTVAPIAELKATAKNPKKETTATKNEILLSKLNDLELNEYTRKKYVSDFNRLLNVVEKQDILTNMKKAKELIKKIDASSYAINTKRGMIQICLYMITNFNLLVNKPSIKVMLNYFNKQKQDAVDENQNKVETETVMNWKEYLDKVKSHFGETSKMYLIAKLYNEVTIRDDFILKIVEKKPKSTDANYLVLTKNNYKLVINTYKTMKKYGSFEVKLTKSVTKLISDYMKSNNLKVGDYLLGDSKLSTYISTKNKEIGISGGINMYRHMTITSVLSDVKSTEEKIILADKMKHSIFVQPKYLRLLKEES